MFEFAITSSKVIWLLAAIFLIGIFFWLRASLKSDFYLPLISKILLTCRAVAALIFVLLLLDLSIEHHSFQKTKPQIAFLWDMSQSMSTDEHFHPATILRSDIFKKLNRSADITHISNMAVPEIYSVAQIRRLEQNETVSDNSTLIRYAEKAARYDEVFLVSDGQSWLGEDIASLKVKDGLNVNVIAVGDIAENPMPEIRSIRYPKYISQGDSIDIKYEIYNPYEESLDCELELSAEQSLRKDKFKLDAFRSLAITEGLAFNKEGSNKLTWSLTSADENILLQERFIDVHPSKLNIVFHADPPDRDVAMAKFVLEDKERYDCYHYSDWTENHPQRTPDVFITNTSKFVAAELEIAPTIVFYRKENGNYKSAEAFKIKTYKPWLLVNEDPYENTRYWAQLPPLQVSTDAPEGEVLLEDAKGKAVIVDVGGVLQINAEGLWKWNLAAYQKDWDGLYEHMLSGMIEDLIGANSGKLIAFDRKHYHSYAFRPFGFNLDAGEELPEDYELTLSLYDSQASEVKRIDSKNVDETFYLKLDQPGDYLLYADLSVKGELLAKDSATLSIQANDLELTRYGVKEQDLKKLAANNGGVYIAYDALDTLIYDYQAQEKHLMTSRILIFRNSYLLYVLMFLALLADWILRKINGGI